MVYRQSSLFALAAILALLLGGAGGAVRAAEFVVEPVNQTVMKSVFGQVQSRDLVPARARIGGTIVAIGVEEGASVKAGEVIATVVDDKLALQLGALSARRQALSAQLDNAAETLRRTQSLFDRGTVAKARLDDAQTQTTVLENQIQALDSEISVNHQRTNEGRVEAPDSGRILSVPVTQGSVVLPGETVVRIAVGGYFLRLSLPERHAGALTTGDVVFVGKRGLDPRLDKKDEEEGALNGKIVKIYPEISNGRVIADVEVESMGDFFVGERTLVSIPVSQRQIIAVPVNALSMRHGIDYVTLFTDDGTTEVAVIPGEVVNIGSEARVEILSGLRSGDRISTP